jgi:hypothetical protein
MRSVVVGSVVSHCIRWLDAVIHTIRTRRCSGTDDSGIKPILVYVGSGNASSPARTGSFSQFSYGASGQANWELYAQDGLYA